MMIVTSFVNDPLQPFQIAWLFLLWRDRKNFFHNFLDNHFFTSHIHPLSASCYRVVWRSRYGERNRTNTQDDTFFWAIAAEDCSNFTLRKKKDFLGHKCLICEIQFKFEICHFLLAQTQTQNRENLQY